MRNRKILFWLFVCVAAWFGRDGVRGQVPPTDLRVKYLEARLANAEAVARYEQSLTNEQRGWRDEASKQQGIMNQVEQEIFKACIASGKLPGRKADSKEPACADKPKDAQSSGSPVNAGSDTEVRGGGGERK
jgi:hypothetical protein